MTLFHKNCIVGASGGTSKYPVQRSLRFNSPDSAFLSRTPGSSGNRKTWTVSLWIKRAGSGRQYIFGTADTSGNNSTWVEFDNDVFRFGDYTTTYIGRLETTQVFRDFSAWGHLLVQMDTTQATASNRMKLYWNGVQITQFSTATYPSQNTDSQFNTATAHSFGRGGSWNQYYLSAYLAEIHFVDGQALTPSSFTETSASTGQLIPKAYSGSYGTNGFYLNFSDNSNTTAATLGKDYSGNGNNFTPTNLSVTAGAGNDSLVDTPTSYGTDTGAGGEVRGNYCTWNPLDKDTNLTLANGNLDSGYSGSGSWSLARATIGVNSGKWYWEITAGTASHFLGIANGAHATNIYVGGSSLGYGYWGTNGQKAANAGAGQSYGATYTTGDVIGVAFDADNWTLTFYKNGVSQGTAFTSITSSTYFPAVSTSSASTASANFGQRPWAYTPPANHRPLVDTCLPAPLVAKPNTVFDVALWSGTSATQSITFQSGLSPDFVWIKARNAVANHVAFDAIRGSNKAIYPSLTNAEDTYTATLTSFDSSGFTLGSDDWSGVNQSGRTYVGWAWDAGSSNSTNTQGSITSTVRANASAGFSVVTVSPGSSTQVTIGHGLGVAPGFIIMKQRNSAGSWHVWHSSFTTSEYLFLNSTAAKATSTNLWGTSLPTSTVFGFNITAGDWVGYAWAPVSGYSSFGSYTGNGSTDGPFVFCGFRPKLVLARCSSGVADWWMYDSVRGAYNVNNAGLRPNLSNAETSDAQFDFLSNGFKIRTSGTDLNSNGGTHIFCAWAENPFQYARAR